MTYKERNGLILRRRLFGGARFKDMAAEYRISPSRVRQIYLRQLELLDEEETRKDLGAEF